MCALCRCAVCWQKTIQAFAYINYELFNNKKKMLLLQGFIADPDRKWTREELPPISEGYTVEDIQSRCVIMNKVKYSLHFSQPWEILLGDSLSSVDTHKPTAGMRCVIQLPHTCLSLRSSCNTPYSRDHFQGSNNSQKRKWAAEVLLELLPH